MKKTLFSFAILAMMFLVSCTKPGPTGPEGPAGTNGTNGTNGNANVIGTNTVALNSGNWSAIGSNFEATITAPAITQAIVDKGTIMVYEQFGSYWVALPYTIGKLSVVYYFTLNTVKIDYVYNDNSQTPNPGNKTYRIVAISASAMLAHPNINWENYEEVKTILY
jgi:hypothetical protein